MSATVVVGAQWGDEGKAKMVDYFSTSMDMVVRYQGGANAGHTVVRNGKKYVFHLIPSGMLYPETECVIANGVAFDPGAFFEELADLEKNGAECSNRIFVSSRAHVVMPYHKLIDELEEQRSGGRIGTTKRGIGPAYTDKAGRAGLRVADIMNAFTFRSRLEEELEKKNAIIKHYYKAKPLAFNPIFEAYSAYAERLAPYAEDTVYRINRAIEDDKRVLFEGSQGVALDLDFGTYPYVTSSHPTAAGVAIGAGVAPKKIDRVIGVFKTYITRVGGGPMPTELPKGEGETLRIAGEEFGATTGRPRNCGWFDGVQAQFANLINGFTDIALTKIDVLSAFDTIKIGIAYKIGGARFFEFPVKADDLENAEVAYQEFKGWKEDISHVREFNDLPERAKDYVKAIEDIVGARVSYISNGPDRDNVICR